MQNWGKERRLLSGTAFFAQNCYIYPFARKIVGAPLLYTAAAHVIDARR